MCFTQNNKNTLKSADFKGNGDLKKIWRLFPSPDNDINGNVSEKLLTQ